ncbi:MAG: ROK family protein [Acidimicrobiia bacterium]|nr:MAG: ROK family protein [Acidimicrobiia bacterium]
MAAALVEPEHMTVISTSRMRHDLDPHGTAKDFLDTLCRALVQLPEPRDERVGIAIPGPFDYEHGIGLFRDVAKFEALHKVDVRSGLRACIGRGADHIRFLNDADAFGLGEWVSGVGVDHDRIVGLTLGTGVGSVFLNGGTWVIEGPTVPPEGRVDLLEIEGHRLEESFSRRAIRRSYRQTTGRDLDVKEIAAIARTGDEAALEILHGAARLLGAAVAPFVETFAPTLIVVGGSITGAWDLLSASFRIGLGSKSTSSWEIRVGALGNDAPLVGAAYHALN